mgnify:CR=1 FL=1
MRKYNIGDLVINKRSHKTPTGRTENIYFTSLREPIESGTLAIVTDVLSAGRFKGILFLNEEFKKGEFISFRRLWVHVHPAIGGE